MSHELATQPSPTPVTVDDWWATLSPTRRVKVVVSVYEDDMAYGRVFAEMRGLALIRPGEARRTADATGF